MAKRFGKSTVAAVTGPRSKQARSNKYQLTIAKLSLAKEESSLGLPGRRRAELPQILLDPSRPSVRRDSRKRDCTSGPALYEKPACENSRLPYGPSAKASTILGSARSKEWQPGNLRGRHSQCKCRRKQRSLSKCSRQRHRHSRSRAAIPASAPNCCHARSWPT